MWLTDATPVQKRTLLAASLGWMLDSMDVLLYSMVLAYMMRDLGMREGTAGLMASLTLAASAVGGVAFGIFADRFGRSRALTVSILVYSLFTAAALVPVYAAVRDPLFLLLLGPLVGFFGTGYFSGFGAITAEIFPTAIRARAQGLTYNLGRGISALSPYLVGSIGAERGLSSAFLLTSGAFLFAGFVALKLPETLGRELR
jgi:MFS family permease